MLQIKETQYSKSSCNVSKWRKTTYTWILEKVMNKGHSLLTIFNNTMYKLKRCSKIECCKQCRYVKLKGTMTKWSVQKLTHRTTQKHVQHHDATDICVKALLVILQMTTSVNRFWGTYSNMTTPTFLKYSLFKTFKKSQYCIHGM